MHAYFSSVLDTLDITLTPFNTTDIKPYNLTEKGIAWTVDQTKYLPQQHPNLTQIRPPPNWEKKYPNGYTISNPPMDISKDEHFQVWMRASGLPNFRKMYAKNEKDDIAAGIYTISIDMSTLFMWFFCVIIFFFLLCLG